jgi:hypothetical protein
MGSRRYRKNLICPRCKKKQWFLLMRGYVVQSWSANPDMTRYEGMNLLCGRCYTEEDNRNYRKTMDSFLRGESRIAS